MLLNIYLGTTAISWATVLIFSVAIANKLEREGYKLVKVKKSFSEKVADFTSTVFKVSIPILNILNAITILCLGDKVYEYIKTKYLKEGKIYKPISNKLNNDCENEILTEENNDSYIASAPKTRTDKASDKISLEEKMDYYEMTPDEMIAYLEAEKQKFLKFQELYGNEKLGETLDKINEQTEVQESKPKAYSLGNNSNLKHK